MSIDLEAIRRRADAATPKPWKLSGDYVSDGIHVFLPPTTADAEFIVHAREDIPKLLAEVDRLTGQLAAVTTERDAAVNEIPHDCSHCKHNPGADAPKDEYGFQKCGCGCGIGVLWDHNAKFCRWE